MSNDNKELIDKATDNNANNQTHIAVYDITKTFKQGATLPNELLLEALDALVKVQIDQGFGGLTYDTTTSVDETLISINNQLKEIG